MADRLVMTPAVRAMALEAVWEIAALMQALVEHHGHIVDVENQEPLVIRGLALRAAEPNSTVMAALDDDLLDERDLQRRQKRVIGEAAAAAASEEGGAA